MADKKSKKSKKDKKDKKGDVAPAVTAKSVVAMLQLELSRASRYKAQVALSSAYHNPFDLRRPSGILSLDLHCGGGLPAGGLSQIDGLESVGKNFLVNQYFKRCQQIYGDQTAIAVYGFEHGYDKQFGRAAGIQIAYDDYEIDVERRHRQRMGLPALTPSEIKTAHVQQGLFAIFTGDAEKLMDSMITLIASNTFQLIAVDSWDALLPGDDQQKSMVDDVKVAGNPLLESRFMRKFHSAMSGVCADGRMNETTVIGIRQVRANMSTFGKGRRYETKGSHAIKHGKLIDISLRPGAQILATNKSRLGKEMNWEVTKGKVGCHEGHRGVFDYYYEPPRVDLVKDLVATALSVGVITQAGSMFSFGRVKTRGLDGLHQHLRLHPDVAADIADAVDKVAGLKIRRS